MYEQYMIDATVGIRGGLICVCPVELDEEGKVTSIVTGLSILSDTAGDRKIIGVFHEAGNEAVEAFCEQHDTEIKAFMSGT